MSRSASEITQEALKLPQSDQFKIARALLENAEMQNGGRFDDAWNDEIERRIAAIDAGTAKGRPFADVLRDLDRTLHPK